MYRELFRGTYYYILSKNAFTNACSQLTKGILATPELLIRSSEYICCNYITLWKITCISTNHYCRKLLWSLCFQWLFLWKLEIESYAYWQITVIVVKLGGRYFRKWRQKISAANLINKFRNFIIYKLQKIGKCFQKCFLREHSINIMLPT